jgi:hypothetical protein
VVQQREGCGAGARERKNVRFTLGQRRDGREKERRIKHTSARACTGGIEDSITLFLS